MLRLAAGVAPMASLSKLIMDFYLEQGPGWALARLRGEIDLRWIDDHSEALGTLFDDCPAVVVVNLAAVDFMDSSGLGFLARCVRTCENSGGKVFVVSPCDIVLKAMEATGLDQYIRVLESEELMLA